MELRDTVYAMKSVDYKERFKAEYFQLKIRYEKLKAFNTKIEAAERWAFCTKQPSQAPEHDCPLELLREQQRTMEEYLHILEIRAEIEKIDLTADLEIPKSELCSKAMN